VSHAEVGSQLFGKLSAWPRRAAVTLGLALTSSSPGRSRWQPEKRA